MPRSATQKYPYTNAQTKGGMCSVLETEYGWAQQEVPTLNSTWVGAGRDAVGGRWTDITVTSSASVAVSASVVASVVLGVSHTTDTPHTLISASGVVAAPCVATPTIDPIAKPIATCSIARRRRNANSRSPL